MEEEIKNEQAVIDEEQATADNQKDPAFIDENEAKAEEIDLPESAENEPVDGVVPEEPNDVPISDAEKTVDIELAINLTKEIGERISSIEDSEKRLFSEVREIHKLYHNEFAGRLKSMQDELERYRKIDKGRVYDDILASIAKIYSNNETLADEVENPKTQKNIKYMLMDIEDLLDAYGMTRLRSSEGEKRNPRHCQIRKRIITDDPEKHDTVAKSYNSGFFIENRTIIKEDIDVFYYEAQLATDESKTDHETSDKLVEE